MQLHQSGLHKRRSRDHFRLNVATCLSVTRHRHRVLGLEPLESRVVLTTFWIGTISILIGGMASRLAVPQTTWRG